MKEVSICMLESANADLLENVDPDVFDHPIDPRWSAEFLHDSRHHLALAVEGERVVGMASGVHFVHPDKAPEMWINEVGVASSHRREGLGQRLIETLLQHARHLGCRAAWVLTEADNTAAMRLYAKAGGREEAALSTMFTFPLTEDAPETAADEKGA